ncbi:MAG: hypothetical protein V3U29_06400 [Phycisphaeraceae bacterium]
MLNGALGALTQFGAAGLMGVLWVWERRMSRQREQQLDDAHARLMQQREHLHVMVRLVQRNTRAIERFIQTQIQLNQVLQKVHDEIKQKAA